MNHTAMYQNLIQWPQDSLETAREQLRQTVAARFSRLELVRKEVGHVSSGHDDAVINYVQAHFQTCPNDGLRLKPAGLELFILLNNLCTGNYGLDDDNLFTFKFTNDGERKIAAAIEQIAILVPDWAASILFDFLFDTFKSDKKIGISDFHCQLFRLGGFIGMFRAAKHLGKFRAQVQPLLVQAASLLITDSWSVTITKSVSDQVKKAIEHLLAHEDWDGVELVSTLLALIDSQNSLVPGGERRRLRDHSLARAAIERLAHSLTGLYLNSAPIPLIKALVQLVDSTRKTELITSSSIH